MALPFLTPHSLLPAFEDGTDTWFRNVGILHIDAGEIPKRTYTIFKSRRKLEIYNIYAVRRETGCKVVCFNSVAHSTFLLRFPLVRYLQTLSLGFSNRFMNLENWWKDTNRGKLTPIYLLSGLVTAVAVFRNPNTTPFCLTTDLLLNVLFSWKLKYSEKNLS
jgi:hypothetical protein